MKKLHRESESTFFQALHRGKGSVLMIDYDGTLAPFRLSRNHAFPNHSLISLLDKLRANCKCRIIIISGRDLNSLIPLVPLNPLPELWASHGLECRKQDGSIESETLPDALANVLAREYDELKTNYQDLDIEKKRFSLAVHWRGMTEVDREAIRVNIGQRWKTVAALNGLETISFDEGIELRMQGKGKGVAVKHILSQIDSNIPCAYIGDDLTDEDAFNALGNRGLKVLLRHHKSATSADIEFESQTEIKQFLERWIHESEGYGKV